MALTIASAADLAAQRRTTGGSGSGDTRSTPSGGSGRTASGGSSGGSRGSTGGGGGSAARPSSGDRSTGSARPATREGTRAEPSDSRPSSGKIARVRSTARGTPTDRVVIVDRGVYIGSCWDCSYWGWYGGRWGWYHGGWWYPERPRYREERDSDDEVGQGYLPYPYAETVGTGNTFVERRATRRNSYGAVSGQYFSDVGSTTMAGRFQVEGALRWVRAEGEYSSYAEPLETRTDRLHTYRIGIGVQPRLGERAYLIAGVGARGVIISSTEPGMSNDEAGGIEGQLGVQLFPRRPLGINVTGRIAAMKWESFGDYFTLRELNTTGSIFVGRIELQGGWHWLKVGAGTSAFGGPMVGTRVWF
jgi:hypothetical protein